MVSLRCAHKPTTHPYGMGNLIIDVFLVKTLSRSLLLSNPLEKEKKNTKKNKNTHIPTVIGQFTGRGSHAGVCVHAGRTMPDPNYSNSVLSFLC